MAAGKLPVDFELKVKLPPPVGGAGYPYQISARDLMANFKYLLALIGSIPDGETINDMLYWDGSAWLVLPGPSGTGTHVLGSVDGTLTWLPTEDCESP